MIYHCELCEEEFKNKNILVKHMKICVNMSYIVYQHICTINNKSYIGYTYKTLEQRWNEHISNALKYGADAKFHRALRKYNPIEHPEYWEHKILEKFGNDIFLAKQQEKFFIKQFDSKINGYNSTEGGDGLVDPCGVVRQKMSDTRRNNPQIPWNKGKTGLFHHSAEGLQKLSDAAKGENNGMFNKHHTDKAKIQMSEKRKGIPLSDECKRKIGIVSSQPVKQFDKDRNFLNLFSSVTIAAQETGTCGNSIVQCCLGHCRSANNFYWCYANDVIDEILTKTKYKKLIHSIKQVDLDGNTLNIFKSLNDLCKQTGYSYTQIRNCCIGKQEVGYGYKWIFINDRCT